VVRIDEFGPPSASSLFPLMIGPSTTESFDVDADIDVFVNDHKPILLWHSGHCSSAFSGLSVKLLGRRKANG
jgi:hypothetical protein